MKVTCIITDDEPIARKGLQRYIEKIDFLELVGICEDALQLNSVLQTKKIDLLFLDIEMPYLSGVDFLKNLSNAPKVIFTTAYENFALQGFELDVLDYLLKPISFDRFLKSSNKAFDYFNTKVQGDKYLFVKSEKRLEKIMINDIIFIEALQNYVSIQTSSKKLLVHSTLKAMQEKLPSRFIQPHKSFIVNTGAVTAIEGNILHAGSFKIPISKNQRDQVMQSLRV
jgi:DNA-binding LytR/AlgR family response regulator